MSPDAPAKVARVMPFDPAAVRDPPAAGEQADRLRRSQRRWAATTLGRRLAIVRELRHLIAEHAGELAATVSLPQRASRAETLAAEILPLADACRFLERRAKSLLAPERLGRRGRPFWLAGSSVELRREPFGVVLVIAASNYPLLLPGVQLIQALVAGNAVVVKPGRGGATAAALLAELLRRAGLPKDLLAVLGEAAGEATSAIEAGVDKVLLTGSLATGQAVLGRLAASVTPAVMELSGCDPVFVRDDADLDLAARALAFGATFNGGFTCIAPRRVLVARSRAAALEAKLVERLRELPAIAVGRDVASRVRRLALDALGSGARICGDLPHSDQMRPLVVADADPGMAIARADVAAPVLSLIPVDGDRQALDANRQCPFELGATIFGAEAGARALAERLPAGVVVINDLIVPTADPRVPFGGRAASGFGVTRGAAGLLELTRVKAVIRRRGSFRPHFDPAGPHQERLLGDFVRAAHARTLSARLRAAFDAVKLIVQSPSRHERRS